MTPTPDRADPTAPPVIALRQLTKTYGRVRAVRDLTVDIHAGRVTGFLGPNGAGKTTTLRLVLGLARPTAGEARVLGRAYVDLPAPMTVVGAALETGGGAHPGRTGRDHLRVLAPAAGVDDRRVDEVLGQVGLADAADRRTKGYSLGMRQRLALAAALLAEPPVLVLDEPANGLDPAGIAWLRAFLRGYAQEGRSVLVSSHVLSEVQQMVDDVVVLAEGALVHAGPLSELSSAGAAPVSVTTPTPEKLLAALTRAGLEARVEDGPAAATGRLTVAGSTPPHVGSVAFAAGVEVWGLWSEGTNLEEQFLRLVSVTAPEPVGHIEIDRSRTS